MNIHHSTRHSSSLHKRQTTENSHSYRAPEYIAQTDRNHSSIVRKDVSPPRRVLLPTHSPDFQGVSSNPRFSLAVESRACVSSVTPQEFVVACWRLAELPLQGLRSRPAFFRPWPLVGLSSSYEEFRRLQRAPALGRVCVCALINCYYLAVHNICCC